MPDTPMETERLAEEILYDGHRKNRAEVVCGIAYGFDSDNDFMIVVESGALPEMRFCLCVRIKERSNLSEIEVRAIIRCLRLAARGNPINHEIFAGWLVKLKNEFPTTTTQNSSDGSRVAIVIGKSPRRPVGRGMVQQCSIAFDKDKDMVVSVATDADKFRFYIGHKQMEKSYSKLQVAALAEVLNFTCPGCKLDLEIFLQVCSQIKQTFNVIKTICGTERTVAHLIPTALSKEDALLTFDCDLPLPPPITVLPLELDWSAATKERLAAAEPEVSNAEMLLDPVNSTRGGDAAAAAVISSLGALNLDGETPLRKERVAEEVAIALKATQGREVVSRLKYGLESGGKQFCIYLSCPSLTDFEFKILIHLRNGQWKLSTAETKAIKDCLCLSARDTKLSIEEFESWVGQLLPRGYTVAVRKDERAMVMVLRPDEGQNQEFTAGHIRACSIDFALRPSNYNSSGSAVVGASRVGSVKVAFSTDAEQFTVEVDHCESCASFAKLEAKALSDVLGTVARPGNKSDKEVFLQHMARLRQKFKIVGVTAVSADYFIARVVPSELDVADANVGLLTPPLRDEVLLPEVHEKNPVPWSAATELRVQALKAGGNSGGSSSSNGTSGDGPSGNSGGSNSSSSWDPRRDGIIEGTTGGSAHDDWVPPAYDPAMEGLQEDDPAAVGGTPAPHVPPRPPKDDHFHGGVGDIGSPKACPAFDSAMSFDSAALPIGTAMEFDAAAVARSYMNFASGEVSGYNAGAAAAPPAPDAGAPGSSNYKLRVTGSNDTQEPLVAEREREERAVMSATIDGKNLIAKVSYGFCPQGHFRVTLSGPAIPSRISLSLRVVLRNPWGRGDGLSWKECRAIASCVRRSERGTEVTLDGFRQEWRQWLSQRNNNCVLQETEGGSKLELVVTPAVKDAVAEDGQTKRLQLLEPAAGSNASGWTVNFETKFEKFSIIVHHSMLNESYSLHQGRVLVAALGIAEPIEKMDREIFLQHLARLQHKNSCLVQVHSSVGGGLTARLLPTTLSLQKAKITFKSEVSLPAVTAEEKLDWSLDTKRRIAAQFPNRRHMGMMCDGCGASGRGFAGLRHNCLVCKDYDLCDVCFVSHRESKEHKRSHDMRAFVPVTEP